VTITSMPGDDPARVTAAFRAAGWEIGSRLFDTMLSVLAVFLGLTFLDRDRKEETVFGILARPVSRTSVFLASWAATSLLVTALHSMRSGPLIVGSAWLDGAIDPLHLLGALAALTGTVLLLTAFLAASAIVRPGYAALAGFAGLYVSALAFRDHPMLNDLGRGALDAVGAMLPLGIRQTTTVMAAAQGTTVDAVPVVEVIVYRLSWIVLLLFVGAFAYSRRDLSR
jgi:hypothetical protein